MAKKPEKPKPKKTKAQIIEWAFSAIFLFGALTCFGLFARNSYLGSPNGQGGTEGAIATVIGGKIEQKRFGRSAFVSLGKESRLFNRDAIWVGPGGGATLSFDDGTGLELQQNTFLVLKRGMIRLGEDAGVQLLKGKVDVKVPSRLFGSPRFKVEMRDRTVVADGKSASNQSGSQLIQTDASGNALEDGDQGAPPGLTPRDQKPTEPQPPNVPVPTSTPNASPRPSSTPLGASSKVNPKPGTLILLLKEKFATVSFSWPTPLDGILNITDDQGKAYRSQPIVSKIRFVKIPLPIGKTYRWRLMDAGSNKTLTGPFEVTVLPFDTKTMDQVIKRDPRRTIEVVE